HTLGLTGREKFDIRGLQRGDAGTVAVIATPAAGTPIRFEVRVRIDTPKEREYFKDGGILHYVLRQLARSSVAAANPAKPGGKSKLAAKAKPKSKSKSKSKAKSKARPRKAPPRARKRAPVRKIARRKVRARKGK
ncbi:MAG: hypothetical protein ACRET4_17470, partial [Steroidobacteraceae bacterium]